MLMSLLNLAAESKLPLHLIFNIGIGTAVVVQNCMATC
jgi:hypothetical protein